MAMAIRWSSESPRPLENGEIAERKWAVQKQMDLQGVSASV